MAAIFLDMLDDFLDSYSYIGLFVPCQLDVIIHTSIKDKNLENHINISRWHNNLKSFSIEEKLNFSTAIHKNIPDKILNMSKKLPDNTCTSTPNMMEPHFKNNKENGGNKKKDGKGNKKGTITLKTPKGTKDYSPWEMIIRRQVFQTIENVFKMHGAVEIETPVFELKEVLTGKYGEDSKLIYNLEDQGGEILSMRYDLTVPFARFVAMNKILTIKRYHIARVYRRDQPAMTKGRYREFYQCDFDIAGQYEAMVTDAECIQVVHQVLSGLQLGNFQIKINHRKLLDGIFACCGVPTDLFKSICSAVDKLDKLSWEEVKTEMVKEKGLDEEVAEKVGYYVKRSGNLELISKLLLEDGLEESETLKEGLKDLQALFEYCQGLNCEHNILFDLGLARGLDYYTGIIYEAVLIDAGNNSVGSIAGGGRYDNLVGMFDQKGKTVPCVGVSFGIERMFAIYEQRGSIKSKKRSTHTEVYVASACKGMLMERLKLVALLHSAGIKAETSSKLNPKLLNQLQFAEDNVIPLVVLTGDSEVADGVVRMRVTDTRTETIINKCDICEHLSKTLIQLNA